MNPYAHLPPNLILVGFMGTGKSSLGRFLAQQWHMRFLDSDHEIERRAGMKIPEIFAKQGEAAFRQMERDWVETAMPERGHIIATGGGMAVQPGMPELLKTKGVVIVLFASPETIYRRTASCKHRPLLQTEDPMGRIRDLLAQREPAYLRAGTAVLTDGRNMPDIAAAVERIYRREIRDRASRR